MSIPTCGTCPLFVRRRPDADVGECHLELSAGIMFAQSQQVPGIRIQQGVEMVCNTVWKPTRFDSVACAQHPVYAALLEIQKEDVLRQLRAQRPLNDHDHAPAQAPASLSE